MTGGMKSMTKKIVRYSLFTLTMLMILVLLVQQVILSPSGSECYFSGDAEVYYQELIAAGFPEDYAAPLTELHLLHPNWSFVPLDITSQNAKHTWSYVIDQETKTEDLNLISKSSTYQAYWHSTNRNEPEAGYYQPSRGAVEYFMDPRNFLNETDIFQFYDLSEAESAGLDAVEAVLDGTFMENTLLENGKTYAQYFYELGKEIGINPIFLAVKVRQEQGVGGTSPIISGTCGTLLNGYYVNQTQKTEGGKNILPPAGGYTSDELLALNGYYNFFNIKASGAGVFQIYENAMNRAIVGTESMTDAWGGSPSWNTRWKSIYGGAYFLKTSYIDRYQSTIYLQKFNVDARSGRTFWGQYMASIYGAMNESRSLYQSFASIGTIDSDCTFLIPVYEGMPPKPCADPASGTCSGTAVAPLKYQTENALLSPRELSAENASIYTTCEIYPDDTLEIKGTFDHSYGVEYLEYRIDDGAWQRLSNAKKAILSLPLNLPENTSHILTIRGKADYDHDVSTKKCSSYFLCAVIYLNVVPRPTATLTYRVGNTVTDKEVLVGKTHQLPISDAPDFAGWVGSDGSFLPSGATVTITENVTYTAVFLDFRQLAGASLFMSASNPHLRFSAACRSDAYQMLTQISDDALSFVATMTSDGSQNEPLTTSLSLQQHGNSLICNTVTPMLLPTDYATPFSVDFSALLTYTNGETKQLCASGDPFARSAQEVARAAIADSTVLYTEEQLLLLKTILQSN